MNRKTKIPRLYEDNLSTLVCLMEYREKNPERTGKQMLLIQLYRAVSAASPDTLDRKVRADFIDAIGETDFRLSEGANPAIQMDALIAKFVRRILE